MPPASEPREIGPLIVMTVILQAALERSMSSAAMPPWLSNDAPNQAAECLATEGSGSNSLALELGSFRFRWIDAECQALGTPARDVEAEPPASSHAHGRWFIQIGAFDGENRRRSI